MRTSARNASRRSRQRRSRLYLCSEWKSPRLCRLRGETAARLYSGWSGRLWPLLCYHLNRRSALESKWTFMPKREEIHPKWCGRTPGGLDESGKADLWPLTCRHYSPAHPCSEVRLRSFSLRLLYSTGLAASTFTRALKRCALASNSSK